MPSRLEYHYVVRRLIAALVAVFSFIALAAMLVVNCQGQVVGAVKPPTGAIGQLVTGAVPGATGSVRPPTGSVTPPTAGIPVAPAHHSGFIHNGNGQSRHHHYASYPPPEAYGFVVPYAVDMGGAEENNPNAEDDDAEYQGGPTVFDRRGSGAESYVPPVDGQLRMAERADADSDPEPTQPTLLVFKDGHQLEVVNYAIVEQTLLDLTPGHTRRVPLSSLDLEATRAQNENRGINFQVPAFSQAN
jgi:hypothetical protein